MTQRAILLLCLMLSILRCSSSDTPNHLSIVPLSENPQNGYLEWQLETQTLDFQLSKTDEGYKVNAAGLFPFANPGEPDLLAHARLFSIPKNWEASVTIESIESRNYTNISIAACKALFRCEAPKIDMASVPTEVFPREPVQLETLAGSGEYQVIRVSLHPFQYDPNHLQLTVHQKISARLRASPKNGLIISEKHTALSHFYSSLTQAVKPKATLPLKKLLVIVEDSLSQEASFKDWIQWKNEAGFSTTISLSSQFQKNASKMLRYVRSSKPEFVVLIGDKNSVPPFYKTLGYQLSSTDYPYALDLEDAIFPVRFVGRIVASNKTELKTQLERSIQSDKLSVTQNWLQEAGVIASDEGLAPSDEDYATSIKTLLLGTDFSLVDTFFESSYTAQVNSIVAALEKGRSWLTYFGHGSGDAWMSTQTPFENSDVETIDNRGKLPILIDVACENGAWTRFSPSFSQKWMTHQIGEAPAGSLAYLGGAIKVSWHEPAQMAVGIADYKFKRSAALLGPAIYAGQIYMLEKLGVNSLSKNNLFAYALYGDPTLLVRTKTLKDYKLETQWKEIGEEFFLTVKANSEEKPVEGLFIGVSENGTSLARFEIKSQPVQLNLGTRSDPKGLKITSYGNGWTTQQTTL